MKKLIRKLSPKSKKAKRLYALVLVIALVLAGVAVYSLLNKPEPPKAEKVITYSTDQPDESKENADNYNWQGAPDEPKKIRIKSLNVDAYIQKAGVDQNNRVAVPNNVHLAGWYMGTMKPGDKGLSVIAGHVSGRTTDGVFKQLGNLKVGDSFEIERGDGSKLQYQVIANKQMAEAKSADVLFSQNPGVTSQVNLITCGGQFNQSNDQYADRIIVSGKLVQ